MSPPSSLSPEGALASASIWASVTLTPSFAAAARIDAWSTSRPSAIFSTRLYPAVSFAGKGFPSRSASSWKCSTVSSRSFSVILWPATVWTVLSPPPVLRTTAAIAPARTAAASTDATTTKRLTAAHRAATALPAASWHARGDEPRGVDRQLVRKRRHRGRAGGRRERAAPEHRADGGADRAPPARDRAC